MDLFTIALIIGGLYSVWFIMVVILAFTRCQSVGELINRIQAEIHVNRQNRIYAKRSRNNQ